MGKTAGLGSDWNVNAAVTAKLQARVRVS